jgi:hypothetical protein
MFFAISLCSFDAVNDVVDNVVDNEGGSLGCGIESGWGSGWGSGIASFNVVDTGGGGHGRDGSRRSGRD